jgi:hypothetical protein
MSNAISLTPGFSPVMAAKSVKTVSTVFHRWQAVKTAHPSERLHHPAEAGC